MRDQNKHATKTVPHGTKLAHAWLYYDGVLMWRLPSFYIEVNGHCKGDSITVGD
jgi:hypothetical protein